MWYDEYLKYKYGNTPNDPVGHITLPMRKLANGHFTGLDDPQLREYLLKDPIISEEDGVNYEQ
jgi:hypothetical protein